MRTYTQNRVHLADEALANALVVEVESLHIRILGIVTATVAGIMGISLRRHVRHKAGLKGSAIWHAAETGRRISAASGWRITAGRWIATTLRHRITGLTARRRIAALRHRIAGLRIATLRRRIARLAAVVLLIRIWRWEKRFAVWRIVALWYIV